MKSPFILPRRIPLSVSDTPTKTWQYLTSRILRFGSAFAITFCLGLVFTGFAKHRIPKTLFTNPITTVTLMKDFPVGASVLPKNTPHAKELFEQFGWWREPAVVVGYDTITYKQELITLCQIRTQRGEGHLLTVNPSWLEVSPAR